MDGREAKNPREKAVYHRGMVSAAHARRAGTSRAKQWVVLAIVIAAAAVVWFRAGVVRDLFGRQYQVRRGPDDRPGRLRHADDQRVARRAQHAARARRRPAGLVGRSRPHPRALPVECRARHLRAAAVEPARPPVRPDQSRVRRRAAAARSCAVVVVALRAHRRERPASVPPDRRRLGARSPARSRTSAGTAARSSPSGCICRAASSNTTRAISRRTSRPASIAATSSGGNSTSPIASTASRSPSRCAWTASRSSTTRSSCSRAPSPPPC